MGAKGATLIKRVVDGEAAAYYATLHLDWQEVNEKRFKVAYQREIQENEEPKG